MAELPRLEYSQIQKALELEDSSRVRGWGELFQTSGMRRRSFVSAFMAIFSQWSGNLLLNLYLVKILAGIGFTDSITQNRITVGFQAWNTISFMTFALTIPRLPRRKVFLCGTCLILGTYVWWIIGQAQYTTTGSKAAGYATLVSLFLFNCAYIMTWNTMMQTYCTCYLYHFLVSYRYPKHLTVGSRARHQTASSPSNVIYSVSRS